MWWCILELWGREAKGSGGAEALPAPQKDCFPVFNLLQQNKTHYTIATIRLPETSQHKQRLQNNNQVNLSFLKLHLTDLLGAYVSMSGYAQATVYVRRPRQLAGVNPLLSPGIKLRSSGFLDSILHWAPLIILPRLHYPLSLKLLLNIRTWAVLTTAQPPTYIQHSLGNKVIRSCDYEPSTFPATVTMHKTPTAAPRVTSRNKKCVLVVCSCYLLKLSIILIYCCEENDLASQNSVLMNSLWLIVKLKIFSLKK